MNGRFAPFLAILCLAGAPSGAPGQQERQIPPREFRESGRARVYRHWTVFFHPRFGYELPVPPGVRARGVPENAAVAEFTSADGAFQMAAWGGLSPLRPEDLIRAEWRRAQTRPDREITYERRGRSWFVVSGTDGRGVEFYEKFTMRGDHVAALSLTFPRARLHEFEEWVEEIEDGFRVVPPPDGPPETAPLPAPPGMEHRRTEIPENPPRVTGRETPPPSRRDSETSPARSADAPKAKTNPKEKIDLTPPPSGKPETRSAPRTGTTEADTPKTAPEGRKEPETKPAGGREDLPLGRKVMGRPGFVYSPFGSGKSLVDVTGIPSGTRVECPYTKKHFRVP